MSDYSQQLANAISAMTKSAFGVPATPKIERPRTLSEILDVDESFVGGFPLHVESSNAQKPIALAD